MYKDLISKKLKFTQTKIAQFSRNSRSELTNIDEKACNNIPGAVNKFALSARILYPELSFLLRYTPCCVV